jgi:hypothetical protein
MNALKILLYPEQQLNLAWQYEQEYSTEFIEAAMKNAAPFVSDVYSRAFDASLYSDLLNSYTAK